jgi:hypothetical protein
VSIRVNGLDAPPNDHRVSLLDFLRELRPGETARLPRHSASRVIHVDCFLIHGTLESCRAV